MFRDDIRPYEARVYQRRGWGNRHIVVFSGIAPDLTILADVVKMTRHCGLDAEDSAICFEPKTLATDRGCLFLGAVEMSCGAKPFNSRDGIGTYVGGTVHFQLLRNAKLLETALDNALFPLLGKIIAGLATRAISVAVGEISHAELINSQDKIKKKAQHWLRQQISAWGVGSGVPLPIQINSFSLNFGKQANALVAVEHQSGAPKFEGTLDINGVISLLQQAGQHAESFDAVTRAVLEMIKNERYATVGRATGALVAELLELLAQEKRHNGVALHGENTTGKQREVPSLPKPNGKSTDPKSLDD